MHLYIRTTFLFSLSLSVSPNQYCCFIVLRDISESNLHSKSTHITLGYSSVSFETILGRLHYDSFLHSLSIDFLSKISAEYDLSFSPLIYMHVTAGQDCSDNSEFSSSYPLPTTGQDHSKSSSLPIAGQEHSQFSSSSSSLLSVDHYCNSFSSSLPTAGQDHPLLISTILTLWR